MGGLLGGLFGGLLGHVWAARVRDGGESERVRLRKCERARPRESVCDIEKVSTREREREGEWASERERAR